MIYAKIINDTVMQIQPNQEDGFELVGKGVCCGMVRDGEGGFVNPPKTPEQIKEDRIQEIYQLLDTIDKKSIRALRAKGRGKEKQADIDRLEDLGVESDDLRVELDDLLSQ